MMAFEFGSAGEVLVSKGKVAILVENDYQDQEVWVPLYRLREEGFEAVTVGPTAASYKSKHGYPIQAQVAAADVRAEDFVGVVIPGGWAPDRLRQHSSILKLVRDLFEKRRVVACICHGGWVLASAGIAKGTARVLTVDSMDELEPGEILVTAFTDTGWTPFFAYAAAVVVDTGGEMSHAAVVAREFGIPCVVNTVTGSSALRTGHVLEVDGATGRVTRVE